MSFHVINKFELLFVAVFESCLQSFIFSDASEPPWTRFGDVLICKQIRISEPVDGGESSRSINAAPSVVKPSSNKSISTSRRAVCCYGVNYSDYQMAGTSVVVGRRRGSTTLH
ncbi:hypothetical protein L1987_32736 [Smallanthus sonchifolius]|uniref:Uncharacterized protein n=1 Tax=Smallanthus sonchifolius TaxID=185202 RepID=A0ACB9HP23_9ASTR|nr:hypothetical protein L1987_32736 [Smallanthus sonchifolius]